MGTSVVMHKDPIRFSKSLGNSLKNIWKSFNAKILKYNMVYEIPSLKVIFWLIDFKISKISKIC